MLFKEICNKQCILSSIGLLLAIFGTLFAIFWMDLFDYMLAKEIKLVPFSKTFDLWKTPPLPMSLDIYFFNWTNPEEFTNFSTKPILEQIGPYRFTEKTDKVNIKWNWQNETVSFRKKSTFYFDAEGSNGSLSDVITTVNVVALSAASKARGWNLFKQKSVSVGLAIYNQQIHVTKLASELLFDGYEDALITMAKEVAIFGDDVEVPFDKFGWFYTRNATANLTGYYNMHTGVGDINQFGEVKSWNYASRTNYFPDHCGMINGSAGEFFPPKQTKDKSISLFTPDLCRSIPFDFEKEINTKGIPGYKYSGGLRSIDNGTMFPDNACFCNGECVPSGTLNISACRFGTPVFMSFPHYYNADPYYLNQVEGMNPDPDKHKFSITLEPTTGIVLDVAAKFQINMLIQPNPNIGLYKDVPYIFMPVLWFEQNVQLNDEMAAEIKTVLTIPTNGYICAGIIILIGLLMILWFPMAKLFNCRHNKTADKTITPIRNRANEENGKIEKTPEVSPLIHNTGILKNYELSLNTKNEDKIRSQHKLDDLKFIDNN